MALTNINFLLSPKGLLTDNITDVAQTLLRQAFPFLSGLQSITCGLTMNFDIEPPEFVQIIHNACPGTLANNFNNWYLPF